MNNLFIIKENYEYMRKCLGLKIFESTADVENGLDACRYDRDRRAPQLRQIRRHIHGILPFRVYVRMIELDNVSHVKIGVKGG